MRRLKKLLIAILPALLLGVACAPSVRAAAKPAPPAGQTMRPNHMRAGQKACLDKLNLSTDKKARLEAINKKFAEKLRAIAQSSATSDQTRTKFQSLMKQRQTEVDRVLTAKQQEQLKKCLQENRPEGGWMGPRGARDKECLDKLNLSADKMAKLQSIIKKFINNFKGFFATFSYFNHHFAIKSLVQKSSE